MKTPESLESAVDCGVIQEVVRPLMSGKEAQVYVVVAGGVECVAKVYKEASQRTFKHRAEYTEGRRTRNSRDQRAMSKKSRHGRSQDEAGWRSTEVDMIYRLRDAGVRVPEPINFVDGVLVMELVVDAEGDPAPRLGDLRFEAREAREIYQQLLREVVRMLCAGVIHGDLSDFNVLMGAEGPVLIDFPQSLDAAKNQGARKFLLRDVENLHRFAERHCPDHPVHRYAEEMWSLYEANRLEPDTPLRGDYRPPDSQSDTAEVLALIEDADWEERIRRGAREEEPEVAAPLKLRTVVDFTQQARSRTGRGTRERGADPQRARRGERAEGATREAEAPRPAAGAASDAAPKKRRSRRRRKRGANGAGAPATSSGATATAAAPDAASKPAATGDSQRARSGEGGASKRRRRSRRGKARSQAADSPGDAKSPERPVERDADARSRSAPAGDRPARRRRRRSRSAGSRGPGRSS